jgi:hypothetical protein
VNLSERYGEDQKPYNSLYRGITYQGYVGVFIGRLIREDTLSISRKLKKIVFKSIATIRPLSVSYGMHVFDIGGSWAF